MAFSDADKLRDMLGEAIPHNGDAADTMFSDQKILSLLEDSNGLLEKAAYEGWRIKAAEYAGLVDVTDGNATRNMSDLLEHAQDMLRTYLRSSAGPTEGRTRIGRIRRGN